MRTKRFNGALLSTLMIVALMAPIVAISYLSVGTVSASPGIENIVRGYATAWNQNVPGSYPPQKIYNKGDLPLIMAVRKDIGTGLGGVIAAGISSSLRNGRWNDTLNPDKHLNVLLDNAFKWIKPGGGKNVYWCDQTIYGVYNTSSSCSALVTALTGLGYTVTSMTAAITPASLSGCDILVVPQFELGDGTKGGDPREPPDSVVAAIENFVENSGKILLITDGNDTFGYNYCKVQNRILRAIWPPGEGEYFQSDSVLDDDNKWSGNNYEIFVNVDNTTSIGAAYQTATGKTRIGLYSLCSLAEKYDHDVGLTVGPVENLEGLPGGTLVYTANVANLGWENDNILLAVSDNIWSAKLKENKFYIPSEESTSTTLTVVIPTSAKFGDNDTMKLTATSENDPTKFKVVTLNPRASSRVYTTYHDTQVSDSDPTKTFGSYIWMWVCSTNTPYNVLTEVHKNLYCYIKFDLRGIPSTIPPGNWDNDNVRARLYAYCWGIHMTVGKDVQCYSVTNDDWTEENLCWDNKPAVGSFQDQTKVVSDYSWYSWDVTNFIRNQLGKDNFASFCLKASSDNLPPPQDFSPEFYPKEYPGREINYPYLAIGYDVDTWITPENAKGMPGGTVSYRVRVMNRGSFAENYLISVVENTKPWTTSLSSNKIEVQPGQIGTVDLNVTIPGSASPGDNDNVLIRAVCEHNSAENDNYWCVTYVFENRIGPAKEDTAAKSTLRLENRVWGRDIYEFGAGRNTYTALPGYVYSAAPARGWLKFDLRAIGTTIARATLNLFCRTTVGGGAMVRVYSVQDDTWSEDNLCWTNIPPIGDGLDTVNVSENNKWYSWDVTDFVKSQHQAGGDNIASFCLVDLGENISPNHAANFTPKESVNENEWPYLKIENVQPARAVRVHIEPVFKGGVVGSTENYIVTIVNEGALEDNYTLENVDILGWTLSLDNVRFDNVPSGENRQDNLRVTIPPGSVGTLDNITVIATSQGDNTVKDNARCSTYRGKANITGLGAVVKDGLYSAQVDVNFLMSSELVVKFYDSYSVLENENVFWSGATGIAENYLAVGHPPNGSLPVRRAVKKAEIVLRGASERVLYSFTTRQSHLRNRDKAILTYWGSYPELWPAFRQEDKDILAMWGSTPP